MFIIYILNARDDPHKNRGEPLGKLVTIKAHQATSVSNVRHVLKEKLERYHLHRRKA